MMKQRRMMVAVAMLVMSAACADEAGGDDDADASTIDPSGADSEGPADTLVVNPGFEQDAVADGQFDAAITPAGWQRYDPAGVLDGNNNVVGVLNPTGTSLFPGGAPGGSNVALVFLWNMTTTANPTGLSQRLSTQVAAGATYTLRVQVGNIAEASGAAYDLRGFPGYRVELVAGGVVLVADDDSLAPADGEFAASEIGWTATASDPAIGQNLEIRLLNLNRPSSGIEVNFDDVELVVE